MSKKTAKPKATPEAKATEPEPTRGTQAATHVVTGGLPRFNFNARPITNEEVPVTDTPVRPSYESIQQEAKGPGVDEWRQLDKARADLTNLYNTLKEDPRYTEEHKAETAWKRYEETRAKVEKLAPEAREKMLRSAEGLERGSIPTPEGEGLITKDTDKLLLTAHERSRIERLLERAEKAPGPFKAKRGDILANEFARGLSQGGPGGGATVRAVYEVARDWGVPIDSVVDAYRKPYHHEALENAEKARMRAELIARHVPEPPFKRGGGLTATGTYSSGRKAFIPQGRAIQPKKGKPYWR